MSFAAIGLSREDNGQLTVLSTPKATILIVIENLFVTVPKAIPDTRVREVVPAASGKGTNLCECVYVAGSDPTDLFAGIGILVHPQSKRVPRTYLKRSLYERQ